MPQLQKHTRVVDDDIEEKEIARDGGNEGKGGDVYDFVAALFCFVKGANAFGAAEIVDKGEHEEEKPDRAEYPFIIPIEGIRERGGEARRREAEQYQNYGREATERRHHNWQR